MANEFIWAHLIHLGSNMWHEVGNRKGREHRSTPEASEVFLFNRQCWNEYTSSLREVGVNTLVVDIGEALRYESHPEIGVLGSWSHSEMKAEIDRLRGLGFELIPKLNFSACHDVWLKDYSRMLSTPIYYKVCRDLIDEVCELFKPRYFHIGMDEETAGNQKNLLYAVIRSGELWWHDLYYLVDSVERNNARAWIWADASHSNPNEYISKMPRSVVQNNWYYSEHCRGDALSEYDKRNLEIFKLLDQNGFTQVPTASTYLSVNNFPNLTDYCLESISKGSLLGMMQTAWERVDPAWMQVHHDALDAISRAMKIAKSRNK